MRTLAITGSAALLVAALAVPSSAAGGWKVITYDSTDPVNTDLDLGEPGLSAGDRQVFVNQAVRGGKPVGYEIGEAIIVEATDNGLKAQITATIVLADGTLTAQVLFVEDFAEGPTGTVGAITGGTGKYRGATGEVTGQFVPDTDTVKTTIRLK